VCVCVSVRVFVMYVSVRVCGVCICGVCEFVCGVCECQSVCMSVSECVCVVFVCV